ncbi:PilZ domain-containing protein [bacterium]|nr:PilZ domain-containing protein [candidate division CSSED10-310 bacterium]
MDNNGKDRSDERRSKERKQLTTPVRARFTLDIDAEIADISPEGMTILFHPLETSRLHLNRTIPVHLEMNGQLVSVDALIQQITENGQQIRLGVKYDRSQIAVFRSSKSHTQT